MNRPNQEHSHAGASIYKRDNGYFIHAEDKTNVGAWIASPPCTELPLSAQSEELAEAVKKHLQESKKIEHPREFKGLFDFVLKKANVNSIKKFMLNCKHCSITQTGEKLIFSSSINLGSKGFSCTNDPAIELGKESSLKEIGKAVYDAINRSK